MGVTEAVRTKLDQGAEALRSRSVPARQRLAGLRESAARVVRYFRSSPRRTFILYPLLVVLAELVERRGRLRVNTAGLLVMLWGFVQFRIVGGYRRNRDAGPAGFGAGNVPDVLLQDGFYAWTRNPMYLGHLLFLFGLATTFRSKTGDLLLIANAIWFHWRVLKDEHLLRRKFGAEYESYTHRVKRWIPYVV